MNRLPICVCILAALAATSCTTRKHEDWIMKSAAVQGRTEGVRDYFEAWNRHDVDAVVSAFSDTGVYNDPTIFFRLKGWLIKRHVKKMLAAFPDLHYEVLYCGDVGDGTVIAEWVMTGTQLGRLPSGTPATNHKIKLKGASVFRMQGMTTIASQESYFDRYAMRKQLGLIRPGGPVTPETLQPQGALPEEAPEP